MLLFSSRSISFQDGTLKVFYYNFGFVYLSFILSFLIKRNDLRFTLRNIHINDYYVFLKN